MASTDEELFPKIGSVVENDGEMPTELESLCMSCGKNGRTRLLFTHIPFFREVILMSFRCQHCGERNNEIQSGTAVQDRGCRYTLRMTRPEDLQRQVIKSGSAVLRIEELDFEIPAAKGVLSTVEGMLHTAVEELRDSQEDRRKVDAPVADQVEAFLSRLEAVMSGQALPATLVVDDPAGNSFVENPEAPSADPNLSVSHYVRTPEQQASLGLQPETYENDEEAEVEDVKPTFTAPAGATLSASARGNADVYEKEVFEIPTPCPNCRTPGTSKTCVTDIPFFKEIVIMAFDCPSDNCGFRSSEIKGGGPVPAQGKLLRLRVAAQDNDDEADRVRWADDMKRDVVKSNTAGVRIPELDLEVTAGSLGGMYTTVEGLLQLMKDTLFEGQASEMIEGDSADSGRRARFAELEHHFEAIIAGEKPLTLEIKDPLANSYIYSPTAPEPEAALDEEDYERSFEEDEDLGLNDMNTDNYDNPEADLPVAPPAVEAVPHPHHVAFEGPCDAFEGQRVGMVFRLGDRGLGYYEDPVESRKMAERDTDMARHKMRDLQRDGKQTHPNPKAVQEEAGR